MREPPFERPEPEEEAPPALSPGQRLALMTALRRLELAAWRLEERLRARERPPLTLTRMVDPFTPEQRAALLARLEELRAEVARLAQAYRLPEKEESLRTVALAEFGLLWSDLEDLRPARLRDYGALSAQAADQLEPQIERLIGLVLAVNALAAAAR
ncbi:hypothetical protein [Thermogemmatispora sp.]|uniref:hypothetical protein n=1 Tax=Thermogemmatispora sp. TaxID=1968838 RepID=UPI0035E454A8